MTDAYVLVQAKTPGPRAAVGLDTTLATVLDEIEAEVVDGYPTVGPFDYVLRLAAENESALARSVIEIQKHRAVGLTLTLPLIPDAEEDSDPDGDRAPETAIPQHGGSRADRPLVG